MLGNKILFIVNPISGGKDKSAIPELIRHHMRQEKWKADIVFTTHAGHAAELSGNTGHDFYVAVGGDGTINEVARGLVGKDSAMGILPMGSGNGLARHIGISMDINTALRQLNDCVVGKMDTCAMNGHAFVNMAGIGFDAHIGKMFAESEERGFKTYVVQTLREFAQYRPQSYKILAEAKEINTSAFLISFANSSQYGNNAYIAPMARLADGLLEVCVMKPFPVYKMPLLAYQLFAKKIHLGGFVDIYSAGRVEVVMDTPAVVHLDGEPMQLGNRLMLEVLPSSLNIMLPTRYHL